MRVLIYRLIRGITILVCITALVASFLDVYINYTKTGNLTVSAVLVSDKYNDIEFEGNNYFIYPILNRDGSFKRLDVKAYDYEDGKCSIDYYGDVAVGVSVDNLEMTNQEYDYLTSPKLLSPIGFLNYLLCHRQVYNNSHSLRFGYISVVCFIPLALVVMINMIVEIVLRLKKMKLNVVIAILFSLLYVPLTGLTTLGLFECYYWNLLQR